MTEGASRVERKGEEEWPAQGHAQSREHPFRIFCILGTVLDNTQVKDIASDLRKQVVYLGM